MPYKKVGKDKYKGPSGKVFNKKQVRMSYATDNFQPGKIKATGGMK